MRSSFALIVIIVLVLLLAFSFFLNRDLRSRLKAKEQEIIASSNYIEILNRKIKEFEIDGNYSDKEDKLQKLLSDYLNQIESGERDLGNNKADSLNFDYEHQKRKEWFIPDLLPISGQYYISQTFSEEHKGIDFAASLGTEVLSAGAGVVNFVGEDKYFGILIEIDHLNGFYTRYAHLAKVLVKQDDLIKKGAVVALVGDTGNSSAPHLHFEIIKDSVELDPEEILKK